MTTDMDRATYELFILCAHKQSIQETKCANAAVFYKEVCGSPSKYEPASVRGGWSARDKVIEFRYGAGCSVMNNVYTAPIVQ